jgi:hypothetical protein
MNDEPSKNFKTMKKKAYLQPTVCITDYYGPIMAGPIVSQQYDTNPHTPIGTDDLSDNFMTKEREEENAWTDGLWNDIW